MSNPVLSHADPMPLAATRSHRATCNTLIRGALELNLMPFAHVRYFLSSVVYLLVADNVSRLLPTRQRRVHQPVSSSQNGFSTPHSTLLA